MPNTASQLLAMPPTHQLPTPRPPPRQLRRRPLLASIHPPTPGLRTKQLPTQPRSMQQIKTSQAARANSLGDSRLDANTLKHNNIHHHAAREMRCSATIYGVGGGVSIVDNHSRGERPSPFIFANATRLGHCLLANTLLRNAFRDNGASRNALLRNALAAHSLTPGYGHGGCP